MSDDDELSERSESFIEKIAGYSYGTDMDSVDTERFEISDRDDGDDVEIVAEQPFNTNSLHIDPDTDADVRGAVPNGEIRELAEWFRDRAGRSPPNARIAFEACADDLEGLIDDHTDD